MIILAFYVVVTGQVVVQKDSLRVPRVTDA